MFHLFLQRPGILPEKNRSIKSIKIQSDPFLRVIKEEKIALAMLALELVADLFLGIGICRERYIE